MITITNRHDIWPQLQAIPETSLATGSPFVIEVSGAELAGSLLAVDRIGCQLARLQVRAQPTAIPMPQAVVDVAARIAKRVNYLLEPLEVMEVDGQAAVALLRSAPPYEQGGVVEYYELHVSRQQGIEMERYAKTRGPAGRQPIPLEFSRESFRRLLNDALWALGRTD